MAAVTSDKSFLVCVVVVSTLIASSCSHITTKVPGVLDVRSDAGAAAGRTVIVRDSGMMRAGFDAVVSGGGVAASGTPGEQVRIEDRKWWLLRFLPLSNASATEELEAALGSGALRRVEVSEQIAPLDILISLVASIGPWSVIGAWLTPSWTWSASAEPVVGVSPPQGEAPGGMGLIPPVLVDPAGGAP